MEPAPKPARKPSGCGARNQERDDRADQTAECEDKSLAPALDAEQTEEDEENDVDGSHRVVVAYDTDQKPMRLIIAYHPREKQKAHRRRQEREIPSFNGTLLVSRVREIPICG